MLVTLILNAKNAHLMYNFFAKSNTVVCHVEANIVDN